ncbi:Putative ribonuclease H protein At1g65750, partial [Linum perenne]
SLLFGTVAWFLWRRRNNLVFQSETHSVKEVVSKANLWTHFYWSCWKALQVSREAPGLAQQAHLIGWRPAEEGWFTMNSDGSGYTNPNRAVAGGLIRDENGRFFAAFVANLGTCSIMRAELRSIIKGTKLAWGSGIRKLRIQSDSKAAVELLIKPLCDNNHHVSLIRQFAELSSQDWQISVHHIYRAANFVVDYLANLGHSFDLGVHLLNSPDVSLQYWLNFDVLGGCIERLISNNT